MLLNHVSPASTNIAWKLRKGCSRYELILPLGISSYPARKTCFQVSWISHAHTPPILFHETLFSGLTIFTHAQLIFVSQKRIFNPFLFDETMGTSWSSLTGQAHTLPQRIFSTNQGLTVRQWSYQNFKLRSPGKSWSCLLGPARTLPENISAHSRGFQVSQFFCACNHPFCFMKNDRNDSSFTCS